MDEFDTNFPKKGDLVKFIPATKMQVEWGGNDDPYLFLTEGQVYEVEKVVIRSYHTKIYLKGITGCFNSAAFTIVERGTKPDLKIAYLHGLESTNTGVKIDWLQSISKVYVPNIDYTQPHIYQTIKTEITAFKPDVITGSSMGGYFAFEIAKEINCPAILFNPALHSRSMEPDRSGHEIGQYNPHLHFILGTEDTVISPKKTMDFINRNKYPDYTYNLLTTGHQTPYKIFRNEVEKYIGKHF